MSRLDREAHRLLEQRHRDIDARFRRRVEEIASALDLSPLLRPRFVLACDEAARLRTADCALADHEFRSGRSSPVEDEIARDAAAEERWRAALAILAAAAPRTARAGEGGKVGEGTKETAYSLRYRPLARITRPLPER